jgi:hypothetical protein
MLYVIEEKRNKAWKAAKHQENAVQAENQQCFERSGPKEGGKSLAEPMVRRRKAGSPAEPELRGKDTPIPEA